jgi:heavy metal translocating P-type ATPase
VETYRQRVLVAVPALAIVAALLLRYGFHAGSRMVSIPLWIAIVSCGVPLIFQLLRQIWKRQFGADFLAGLSITTAVVMGELLVAVIIILMLTGGEALESFATRRASSVLHALAKRMPSVAHRVMDGRTADIAVNEIAVGDRLVVYPHEICPVDGSVLDGTGSMDESFLTGEPFRMRKTKGSQVISGALNEDAVLTIVAEKPAADSRYARIMQVMREAEENPPAMRRLADQLGGIYTPVALGIAALAWGLSGHAERFLAVLVIATPCPLLLAIPVAIIGAISLAARRGVVIRKPAILEQMSRIRVMFFDKTGTLTHGEPTVTEVKGLNGFQTDEVLAFSAALERYSKHPLASAILEAAGERHVAPMTVTDISERPGEGLSGDVHGRRVLVTGRRKLSPELKAGLPEESAGLECVVLMDGRVCGVMHFHDRPRKESRSFVQHLGPKHNVEKLMILTGDRDSEARHLAEIVGIQDIRANLAPEEKLALVREATRKTTTLFLGDGINDAPAMMAATVGVALGQGSDIVADAAGAVILESSLGKVDELLHIGQRMRRIALESAVGGMALSAVGMLLAATGHLAPIAGAISQEVIDLLAVLNALRASLPSGRLQDF